MYSSQNRAWGIFFPLQPWIWLFCSFLLCHVVSEPRIRSDGRTEHRRRMPIGRSWVALWRRPGAASVVRCEASFDIRSQVSVDFAMGMVQSIPKRQLEAGDILLEPLFDEPRTENATDFWIGVSNQVQRRTYKWSIARDMPPLMVVPPSNFQTIQEGWFSKFWGFCRS